MDMTTATRMTDPGADPLLALMTWLSPAFPTGGFSYSHGLEWLVEDGAVTDEAATRDWLTTLLDHGSAWCDALLLCAAHRAADDAAQLADLADLAAALPGTAEWALETTAQGDAFRRAIAAGWPDLDPPLPAALPLAYPVAVGALCGRAGVPLASAAPAFLQAVTAHLISAAVRLVPLGQSAAQRLAAAANRRIPTIAARAQGADLDQLGSATLRLDLASMAHETQYTRLFRS